MLNKNSFFYRMCYFSTALPFFLKKFCVANSIYNMRDRHTLHNLLPLQKTIDYCFLEVATQFFI